MINKLNFLEKQFTWPICRKLLFLVLEDKVSDLFVCELVWERLFYSREESTNCWFRSSFTPFYWSEKFVEAPQIISERKASVHLTRSIPKNHKQGLKEILDFKGYKIDELYPRKTRRATAVNWLIYWSIESNSWSIKEDILPEISSPPVNQAKGHFGDPEIN